MAVITAVFLYNKRRLAVLLIAIVLGATIMSIRIAALDSSAINQFRGAITCVELQVTTDPNRVVPKVFGSSFAPISYSFMGQALRVDDRYSMRIPVRVIISNKSVESLLPGQKIRVQAKVLESKEGRVAALLIVKQRVEVLTQPSRWARVWHIFVWVCVVQLAAKMLVHLFPEWSSAIPVNRALILRTRCADQALPTWSLSVALTSPSFQPLFYGECNLFSAKLITA
jgi:hypothetical protein